MNSSRLLSSGNWVSLNVLSSLVTVDWESYTFRSSTVKYAHFLTISPGLYRLRNAAAVYKPHSVLVLLWGVLIHVFKQRLQEAYVTGLVLCLRTHRPFVYVTKPFFFF